MFPVKIAIPRQMIKNTYFGRITECFFKYSKTEDLTKIRIARRKLEKPKDTLPFNYATQFPKFTKIDPPVTKRKIIIGKTRL